MFDNSLPVVAELAGVDDSALISAMSGWARVSAAAEAQKLAVIAELVRRRCTDEHPDWACDDWDAAAAEVSAALTIGHGHACGQMDRALALRDRLPGIGALLLVGDISPRIAETIVRRTELVTDPEALSALDQAIVEAARHWGPLSQYKLEQAVDIYVEAIDPDAVRRVRNSVRGRDFSIGDGNDATGTASVWGRLTTPAAMVLRERINAMARGVCDDDPRTMAQRRADALGALGAGSTHLACHCDNPDCPAAGQDAVARTIVVHVVADGDAAAEPVPARGDLDGENIESPPPVKPRKAALIPGVRNGVVPPVLLADLIANGATVRRVDTPSDKPEPQYRPSTALDQFVRMRDLTCTYPGCDRPAVAADIDHTTPWPAGQTAPWCLSCKCRKHHLVKTFWAGWSDRQEPDGTVIWTTPTGHEYVSRPFSGLLFPRWPTLITPSGDNSASPPPNDPNRSLMMPTRKRTRAQAREYRIRTERAATRAERGDSGPESSAF